MKKITFIDVLIVLFVAVVAAAAVIILKPGADKTVDTRKLSFTVLATAQQEGLSELVKAGDDVVISFSEDVHATVVEAYEEDRVEYHFNNFTGKYVSNKIQEKSDVYVKLTADVTTSDTKFSKDNLPIRVGDEMPVRGKGYVVKGYVVEVTEE